MQFLITDIVPVLYEPRSYYPHMSPEDTALWNRFIEANPEKYQYVYYDLPVGTIPDLPDRPPLPWQEKYARQTYSKRIDVVGIGDGVFDIIELKPAAGMIAIGQVLMYAHCIKPLLPEGARSEMIIITDTPDPDLAPVATDNLITVIEKPAELPEAQ